MAALALPPVEQEEPTEEARPTFATLSETAKAALAGMLTSALNSDKVGRREAVRQAWKLRDYCKGRQHNLWDKRSYVFITPEASGEELPMHMGTYDITSPHKRSFVSILSENPPGVNFVPNDLQKGNDVTAAKLAEKMRARVDRMVQMKDRQQKAAGYLCTDGPVVSWVRVDEVGKLRVHIYGVLEAKFPLYAESEADWDYCVLSKEVSEWRAKFDNPDFADKIESASSATSETQYERYARLAIVSKTRGGSPDSLKGLVTEHYAWIKPWRYLKLDKHGVRPEIEAAFPSGVRIHAFGDVVVDAIEEDMSALAIEFPVDGEGQMRPALLSGVPDIQDAYNDVKNLIRELAEYGTPATWVDLSSGLDLDAIAEQRSEPGAVHGMNVPSGKGIEQCVFQEEPAAISAQVTAMLPDLKLDAEFTTGDFPALYGGDTPGQDTVGVNKLLNNQAKGQLGPAWSAIQRLWAKIYPVAIRLAAQLEQGPVAVDGGNGQDQVDPMALLDGEFSCHPDQDSSFPETTADKRAALGALTADLASAGDGGVAILAQPDNLKLRLQLSGLSGVFIIPGAEARDKQLREIERLLGEQPIPPSMEEMQQWQAGGQQGPPPAPTPSVSVDPDWDYHQPEYDKVQEFLSSDARAEEERKGNFAGLMNVRLHGQQHKDALAKQAAAVAPKQPPMAISGAFKDLDPATKVQALVRDGYQPDQNYYEAGAVQEQQGNAAETQKTAADAQHKSVLAAREETAPVHAPPAPKAPDQVGGMK